MTDTHNEEPRMTSRSLRRPWALVLVVALAAGACGSSTASPAAPGAPTSSPSPSADATATTSQAPEAVATVAPTPAATPSPTATPAATATPAPSSGPVTGSPTGQTGRITLQDVGLTVTLPKGWQSVPLTADDIDKIVAILPPGTLPAGFEDQIATLMANGLRMFAVDTRGAGRGATLNVLVIPAVAPLAFVRTSAKAMLKQLAGVTDIRIRDARFDGREAVRVDYTQALTVLGMKVKITGVQVWVPLDTETVVLTIGTPKASSTADRDAILKSLRFD
jgi:hypothetical protein